MNLIFKQKLLLVTRGLTEHPEHHVLNPHGEGFVLCRDRPAAETQDNTCQRQAFFQMKTLSNKPFLQFLLLQQIEKPKF